MGSKCTKSHKNKKHKTHPSASTRADHQTRCFKGLKCDDNLKEIDANLLVKKGKENLLKILLIELSPKTRWNL